jgi:hypothetical protein
MIFHVFLVSVLFLVGHTAEAARGEGRSATNLRNVDENRRALEPAKDDGKKKKKKGKDDEEENVCLVRTLNQCLMPKYHRAPF